jgi:hypothetical protein
MIVDDVRFCGISRFDDVVKSAASGKRAAESVVHVHVVYVVDHTLRIRVEN